MWIIERVVSKGDYNYAVVKNHPRAIRYGYVLEHIIVAENMLKRILEKDEIVHHIDGNKKNNNPENLEVMNKKDHNSLHGKMVGKNYVELKCPECDKVFLRARNKTFLVRKTKYNASFCSQSCSGSFSYRANKLNKMTDQMILSIQQNVQREYKYFEIEPIPHTHSHCDKIKKEKPEPISKKKKCPNCTSEMYYKSKFCKKCSGKLKANKSEEYLSIVKDMYEKSKSTPYTQIAKEYGICDNAVRKRIKSAGYELIRKHKKKIN